MDAPSPRAASGFGLVAVAQSLYLLGALAFGDFGVGALVSLASALAAVACAYASWMGGPRTLLAAALGVFAAAQLVDYVRAFGGPGLDAFTLGFTLVVVGLVVAAVGAWRWSTYGDAMPRPTSLRVGGALAAIGSFSYIAIALAASFSFTGLFSLGALAAATGWALVAWG